MPTDDRRAGNIGNLQKAKNRQLITKLLVYLLKVSQAGTINMMYLKIKKNSKMYSVHIQQLSSQTCIYHSWVDKISRTTRHKQRLTANKETTSSTTCHDYCFNYDLRAVGVGRRI